ncbi:hypothetical protein E4T44_00280 [Aureobasidium sp. EXF-8845]|nr:hypothetical protein E4T44_00280 [Aureobasidium sp. EXF-8845]
MTSGPRDWQRARRRYVRQIIYRVVVPYWLDEDREKDDGYTYDNALRRENNRAFSEGVCRLFEHLATWTNQALSLKVALQATDVSTHEDVGEPKSIAMMNAWRSSGEEIAPYCAEFVPRCVLPRASCITSLEFLELITPNTMWYEAGALDIRVDENKISLPARLSIASACSGLKKIRLDRGDEVPSTEPSMCATRRTAAAEGYSQLPRTIKDMTLCGYLEPELEMDTLQTISTQLQHLRLESLAIYQELICPDGIYWPYLETLHLKNQSCDAGPFGGVENAAKSLLIERWLNDLYTSLGHAAQKMPCLKSVILTFAYLDHELELSIKNKRWYLTVCVMDNYQPSPEVLEAWKVPGGSLQPCINQYWQEAIYPYWPPS